MPPRKKAAGVSTPVEALRPNDTRANIPTGEPVGFVPDEVASLAERERLCGKVQIMYLDPPYGIRFGSNWQVMSVGSFRQDRCVEGRT